METTWYEYQTLVTETMLDIMGHLNHARYLTLYEEARWQLCNDAGHSLQVMQRENLGFVILDAYVQYKKEVCNRDALIIRTRFCEMNNKVWTIEQTMERTDGVICSTIKIKAALFDLKARKLVIPTATWWEKFQAK